MDPVNVPHSRKHTVVSRVNVDVFHSMGILFDVRLQPLNHHKLFLIVFKFFVYVEKISEGFFFVVLTVYSEMVRSE